MKNSKSIGVRDIAQKCNLNISTVSRALNRSPKVAKDTMEYVLRTANQMGYHLSNIQKQSHIIIILPDSAIQMAWYSLNMINALTLRLREKGYSWEFINADQVHVIQERSVGGIISFDFCGNQAKQLSQNYQLPVICINDQPNHTNNVYSVISDDKDAIKLALDCLYSYGHKKIAFINFSNESEHAFKRQDLFNHFAREKESYPEYQHVFVNGSPIKNHGLVLDLSKSGITAIICGGESSGLLMVNSLNACNIRIPKDMSLITWELPFVSALLHPALTTVGQDFAMLAEKAVQLLEEQQNSQKDIQDIIVPYKLFLRESVSLPSNLLG